MGTWVILALPGQPGYLSTLVGLLPKVAEGQGTRVVRQPHLRKIEYLLYVPGGNERSWFTCFLAIYTVV